MDRDTNRGRVQRHRDELRRRGLRPVQLWIPDTQAPGFLAEARRQCELINRSPHAEEDQQFVDGLRAGTWDVTDTEW